MTFEDLLARVIEDGILAAAIDYRKSPLKRAGAIAGFQACRGKTPAELALLLADAADRTRQVLQNQLGNYWYHRCFELEVGWCCNVVSAALMNEGHPVIVSPTARGIMKAAEIVGVKGGQ